MKRILLNIACLVTASFFFLSFQTTEKGYDIEVNIKNFTEPYVILAYHYGDKPYIKDTLFAKSPGKYHYKGDVPLDGGMYMIVLPPKNNSIDLFIDDNEQNFTVDADMSDLVNRIQFKNSKNNTIFYDYLKYLNQQRPKSDKLAKDLEAAKKAKDNATAKSIEEQLVALNKEVTEYQKNLIKKNPEMLVSKFIKTSMDLEVPDAPKLANGKTDSTFAYRYYREHYFEHCDLTDGRLIRTPLLPKKVDRYLDKVVPQHPDSVKAGVDRVLKLAENDEDMFKFFLISLINKYAKTKVVCMDAVYVHIADNYYLKGKADWISQDQLDKIKDDADRLRPLQCGEIAPNITLQTFPKKEGDKPVPVSLHGIDARYTVMIFWAPDCGHCKKTMPKVVEFYDKYKSKDIEIFSVCTKTYKDYDNCKKFIEEKDMGRMLNLTDPYLRSKFPVIYDIKSTPVILVLDRKKKIVSKRIGGEQLGEVIDNLFKREEYIIKQGLKEGK